jgi:hypothetical protein
MVSANRFLNTMGELTEEQINTVKKAFLGSNTDDYLIIDNVVLTEPKSETRMDNIDSIEQEKVSGGFVSPAAYKNWKTSKTNDIT